MNRQRYEPLSQRDHDTQPVILSPIPTQSSSSNPTHYNYNFNTGLPTSISSSSSIAPSIPTSPPPSFHTTSSPGTPRPLPSQELWGVAPSTITLDTSLSSTGPPCDEPPENELSTIASLKQRVEWLEESIGRLLLSKEPPTSSSPLPNTPNQNHLTNPDSDSDTDTEIPNHRHKPRGRARGPKRHNCCVTFSAADPDTERALRRESNCCVRFKSAGGEKNWQRERQVRWMLMGSFCFFVAVVGFTVGYSVVVAGGGRGAVASSGAGVAAGGLNVRM